MQTASRISRHSFISGDCSICMDPLKGPVARRACGHIIHTQCYFDKMIIAGTDASVNVDACELCRAEVCSKTRHGSTLVVHFPSAKRLVAATTTKKDAHKSDPPREPIPRRVAPSSSGAGSEKHKEKSTRLKKRKAKEANKKTKADDGGFTMVNRSTARVMGIRVPVGDERT